MFANESYSYSNQFGTTESGNWKPKYQMITNANDKKRAKADGSWYYNNRWQIFNSATNPVSIKNFYLTQNGVPTYEKR